MDTFFTQNDHCIIDIRYHITGIPTQKKSADQQKLTGTFKSTRKIIAMFLFLNFSFNTAVTSFIRYLSMFTTMQTDSQLKVKLRCSFRANK